ncbi:MAG: hypothetical protein WCQ77_06285 [Planctomycetota bacterium]
MLSAPQEPGQSPVKRRIEGHCTNIVTDLTLEWLDGRRDATKPFLLMLQHKAPHREWAPPPGRLRSTVFVA